MRNRWIEYETSIGEESDAGGEPVAETPEVPAEPEWTPPGQDWYGNINQFVEQAGPVLQQMGQLLSSQQEPDPAYAQYVEPEYVDGETDPVEYVNELVNARVQAALEGYEPILGFVAQREAENATREALSVLESEVGKFDHDQAVFTSLGLQNQGLDPEYALRVAATRQREFEERIRNEAVEEYKASLGRSQEQIAQQPGTSSGAAAEIEATPTGPDKYTIMAERWAQDQLHA